MTSATRFELLLLGISLGVGGLFGWLSEHYAAGFLVALTAVLLRHLYFLLRLTRRLDAHARLAPPFTQGAWGRIESAISNQQLQSRRQKRRQVRFAQRFREAAVSVPDAFVALDKNLCLEWSNPAARRLLGARWPEDQGKPLAEAVPHPDLADYLAGDDFDQPLDLVPEHNKALRLSVRITPFGEKKRQWLVVARDVTKIYNLDLIRRDFVANASHELRTPLTVISGFLETLADTPNTPIPLRRPVEVMLQQASRMKRIIEDLLALSRLELGERPSHIEAVDVPKLLEELMERVSTSGEGQHPFDTDIDPNLLLMGSTRELESAFSNLITNAMQHAANGERIRVVWQQDDQGPLFKVQDFGAGIEPEHIPRLTEHFYRVDQARSRESGGTGLGLSIVNHVLNRHHGQLLIASQVGEGSTFTCRFAQAAALHRRPAGRDSELHMGPQSRH